MAAGGCRRELGRVDILGRFGLADDLAIVRQPAGHGFDATRRFR
jgi:hypothetical protein